MSTDTDQDLHKELTARFLHRRVGPFYGWDPVNEIMVRHWCAAMSATPPPADCHQPVPAPMLQVWNMPGFTQRRHPESSHDNPFAMFELMDEHGYTAIVAVNAEQEYHCPIKPGDKIHYYSEIDHISEQKQTALGTGFFITERGSYFNQNDVLAGETLFRVLRYSPRQTDTGNKVPQEQQIRRMQPVKNHDTNFFWQGVDRGVFLIQQCTDCRELRFPPGAACPKCQSLQWNTLEASGKGFVYSYVVMHHPPIPPFKYPHSVALVELEEGIRFVAELVDVAENQIDIGMPVEAVYLQVEEQLTMPAFRPVKTVSSGSN